MTEDQKAVGLVMASPFVWMSQFSKIENKDGKLVTPVPSKVQRDVIVSYEYLTLKGLPVRIAALPKARQSYVSTVTAAIFYHHWRRRHCNLLLCADENDRVIELWALLQRFHRYDGFENMWGSEIVFNTEFAKQTYTDEDGRKRECFFRHETSSDPDAGAATSRAGIWFSEICLYPREGDAADFKMVGNALASVGNAPETVCIMESRAKGPGGLGYSIWQGAKTLQERIAGQVGNGWVKVFCPWHEVAEYCLDPKREDNTQWFDDTDPRFEQFRDREKAGIKLYGWTPEQVAWRRWKLISEMNASESEFDSQFPESEEAAFRATGNPRMHPVGIANLTKYAETWHDRGERGTLEENNGKVGFIPDPLNGWLWLKERPIVGTEVCMISDLMTGEQSAGSNKRDCHAVGILRNAYRGNGIFHPLELVAAIDVSGGCRWDIDVLAEKAALLSKFYRDCMVVPEANNSGMAYIVEMRNRSVPVYQRDQIDHINPGKKYKVHGFQTNPKTRPMVIEALAKAVRESSGTLDDMLFLCAYKPAVQEMSTLVTNDRGKVEGSGSNLDDWALAIAIGLLVDTWSPITADVPRGAYRERLVGSGVCS